MKPIRILHMIGSMNIGGSQTLLLNLYRAMDREKIQFDFVLDHPDERALADSFAALGARIYTMPSFYFTNTCQVRSAWNRFFTEHPEYKVLHCHVRSYVSLFLPIAKRHGVKVVLHSHSTSNGTGPKAILKALLQYPLRYQADAFLSCSEEAGRWLFGRKVANSAQHQVLKNAICAEQYRYDPALRQQYRSQLSLNGKTVYAHIGRFTPQKNHAFLLRVFQKIYQANQNAFLLLVGDGETRKQIHSQIQKLGLQDKVLLLGNRQDVAGILQAADVFLFPSHWEGLGTAVVEAQAAGLKCICSEGVPSIAKVVPNCRFLPLREELWIKAALDVPESRTDVYETVVSAGYDAKATALWLQKYYMELVSKRRYLFASATDFEGGRLTGAHRRFLELMTSVAREHHVSFVGRPISAFPEITQYPISMNPNSKLPRHVAGFLVILRVLKREKRELRCDHAISFSPVTTICYRLAGIPHIVSLFREDLIGYQKALQAPKWKLAYFRWQERLAVCASEKILVQCRSDWENLLARNEKYCPGLAGKLHIQINNANAGWMAEAQPRETRGGAPVFLFAGNFSDRRKGHFLLLPAAIRLLEEGYAFSLLCAGDGKELLYWQQQCQNYTAIHFLGHVKDLGAYMRQADALLVPSLIDSCPNVVLEGLQAGLAVYGSRTGGIIDLLEQDFYLFQPDMDSIYAFLREVLETERYRTDAIDQQKRKESLCFDWGQKIQEWIET